MNDFKFIICSVIENPDGHNIGLVKINRPDAMNALNIKLMKEISETLTEFDQNSEIGCMIITGDEKAFAAGADIKEMVDATSSEMVNKGKFDNWDNLRKIKKPLIAAVDGYALGGGCELAMSCDIIVASENSKFGQPEINLGIIPGAGGTQRLTRAIGKARAMEMILTGKIFSAKEMLEAGLLTKIVDDKPCLEEAINLAKEIASKPALAVQLAKECILKSFDTTVEEGINLERKNFCILFDSEDKREGMNAFIEKRKPKWKKNKKF